MSGGAPTDPRAPWLALLRAPGLGRASAARLLERWRDAGAVLAAPRAALAEHGLAARTLDGLARPDWAGVGRDLEWLAGPRRALVTLADPAYPALLRQIADPPPALFVHGDPAALAAPQLAVVGSRNATRGGAQTAFEFARALSRLGCVITSGLALGIDAAAHRGALAGASPTVAVLATGPEQVYPARHRDLAEAVAERGACVTEQPVGTPVRREAFPHRNRIMSALALGTLVVEAAPRSGSLTTARHAAEQGREVFAIPGSIHNPLARGCHALIRDGAKLVETVEDILEELGPFRTQPRGTPQETTDTPTGTHPPEHARLLECLGHDPVSIDELVDRSGLTAREVSSMLLMLELEGHVNAEPGGVYTRARHN